MADSTTATGTTFTVITDKLPTTNGKHFRRLGYLLAVAQFVGSFASVRLSSPEAMPLAFVQLRDRPGLW